MFRLLLGIGVGGMYPLSASHSAEGETESGAAASRVGRAFLWQTPGSMAPYAVAMIAMALIGPRQCPYFATHLDCVGASSAAPTTRSVCRWDAQTDISQC